MEGYNIEKLERNTVPEVTIGKERASEGMNKGEMGGFKLMNFVIRSDTMTSQIRVREVSILLKNGNGIEIWR